MLGKLHNKFQQFKSISFNLMVKEQLRSILAQLNELSSSSKLHSKILIKTYVKKFNSLDTIVLTTEQLRSFLKSATLISQLNLN